MSNPAWGEWKEAFTAVNSITREEVPLGHNEQLFTNGLYTVCVTVLDAEKGKSGALWLSIRRQDRKAIRDWRHFQRIKSELAGEEREGIEIFPPESQLVDGANQYHLWILPEGATSPFTWHEGRKVFNDANGFVGAIQRPYEKENA